MENTTAIICWVHDDDSSFRVNTNPENIISDLKEAIVKKKPNRFREIDPDDLKLYVANIPDTKAARKEFAFRDDQELAGSKKIKLLFPDGFLEDTIHFAIKRPAPPQPSLLASHEPPKQGKLIKEMLATFDKIAPSAAKYGNLEEPIEKGNLKIYANRPFDFSKVPLGLLDPIFGSFCDLLTTINPTDKDNKAFVALRHLMLIKYDEEKYRQKALHEFFLKHFKIELKAGPVFNTSSKSDGHAFTTCGKFIRLLIEVKNEITSISSDPYFQTLLFYKDYLEQLILNQECDYLSRSTIPVMIVIAFGTYLQITGVLITAGGILSEPFTAAFSFCADPNDDNHRLAVARCLAALRESLVALDQHYQGFEDKPDLPFSKDIFPYKSSFTSLAGDSSLVNFKYIDRPFKDRLLYLASKDDDEVVIIKYTRQYSGDAHKLLSDEGFAPKLYGFESIPGGWKMVVMKYIDKPYQLLCQLEPENRGQFENSIQQSVSLLHEKEFVHGDLRPSNVLVSINEQKALIIDFDFAGNAGMVVYPPHLNTDDIRRPKNVKDGVPITKAHDNYMFKRLFTSEATRSCWKEPR